jgi:iron complex outermembrane receptor protein
MMIIMQESTMEIPPTSEKIQEQNKIYTSRIKQLCKYSSNLEITPRFYYNGNTESVSAGAFGVTSSPNVGLRSTFTLKNEFKDFENRLDFGTEIQNSVYNLYRFTGSSQIH